jgi:hypothetical protein
VSPGKVKVEPTHRTRVGWGGRLKNTHGKTGKKRRGREKGGEHFFDISPLLIETGDAIRVALTFTRRGQWP